MKNWAHYKITPTRFNLSAEYYGGMKISGSCAIYIGKQPNVGWRFVVDDDGDFNQVGSIYNTKDEILAALPEYAKQWAKEWQ